MRKLRRDLVISSTIDINYVDYFLCMSRSLAINSPKIPLHVRLININDPLVISKIQNSNPSIMIEYESVDLSTKRKNLRGDGELLYGAGIKECLNVNFSNTKLPRYLCSDLQCYTSNTRFRNINKLFGAGYDGVIYMDADSIVRKDILDICDELYRTDISCNVSSDCKRYPNGRCWECSFLFIKKSDKSIEFINNVISEAESDMSNWDSDQFALENVFKTYRDVLYLRDDISHIEDLGPLHEKEFSRDTFVWAGSGKVKQNNQVFIDEMKKYKI